MTICERRGVTIKPRQRWGRRWRRIALPDGPGDVAPASDIPIRVTHSRIPANRIHPQVAGLHRGISGAPVTGAFRVVWGTTRPRLRRRTGAGMGGIQTGYPRDTTPQQHGRRQPYENSPHSPSLWSPAGPVRMGRIAYFWVEITAPRRDRSEIEAGWRGLFTTVGAPGSTSSR